MLIAAMAAAATLATHAFGQGTGTGIEIRAVRFWVPDAKRTNVMATIQVPYALATPVGTGPAAYLSYLVGVKVLDDKHNVLHEERWPRHAAASMLAENASGVEEISFAVPAGTYELVVDVTDSATARTVLDSAKVSAFASEPAMSDLLVASRLRAVSASDTSTQVGELARGNYRFNTAPTPHISSAEPTIGFLVEAYSPDSTSATMALKIAGADGTDLVPLTARPKSIPAGGGIIGSQVSLEGLPAGSYLLKAAITVHGQTIERQAPFVVNDVPVSVASNVSGGNMGLDEVYFRSLPEDSLDAAAEELELTDAPHSELSVYKRDELSLEAKRRFLIEFWAKRDPNRSTPENEARVRFYQAVGYANQFYGTRFIPGWKTARGKVFAVFGPPDDSLASHMAGRGIPYLVWRYTHGKSRYFIFGDRENNNNFLLMRSNEVAFPGTPGWIELITPEASEDIARWLGLNERTFINNP